MNQSHPLRSLFNLVGLLFFLCSGSAVFGQVAAPLISASAPFHQTLDQRTIAVNFTLPTAPVCTGTTTSSQWSVTINGSAVGITVTGISTALAGPFVASPTTISPTNTVIVQFDASGAPGHTPATPYVLPGEILRVVFTNTGNTLKTGSGPGLNSPVVGFTAQSRNVHVPTCAGDLKFRSSGVASVEDQCAPVNADFFRWTYQYSLRYRNSTNWNTANNQISVAWNAPGGTSTIAGFLSGNGGTPNTAS